MRKNQFKWMPVWQQVLAGLILLVIVWLFNQLTQLPIESLFRLITFKLFGHLFEFVHS